MSPQNEVVEMVKLQEVNGRYSIAIPAEKVVRVGWQKGDTLDWNFNEKGDLELTKINPTKED